MHNPIEIYRGTDGQAQAEVRFNQKAGSCLRLWLVKPLPGTVLKKR